MHNLKPAQSLYLTLLYPNQSLRESCFHNLPSGHEVSKDTQLLDLTLNVTVPFISAGILGTHCTGVFTQRSRVYLNCFGGKVFPDSDESQSDSSQDLSLRSLTSIQRLFNCFCYRFYYSSCLCCHRCDYCCCCLGCCWCCYCWFWCWYHSYSCCW